MNTLLASERPLILLDVDGVLNAFVKPGISWVTTRCYVAGVTYNVCLNPSHGAQLLALAEETGAELVWATAWEHDANTEIGPKIGLPELPVIEVGNATRTEFYGPEGAMFKTPYVAAYVKNRPFIWFDDDLTALDEKYLTGHPGVDEFMLMHIERNSGLNDEHLAEAKDWLLEHGGA